MCFQEGLTIATNDASFLCSATDPSKLGVCAAEIAFVGRSNVGKSTLLNALCGKDVARVSRTPGRTRTLNVFLVARDRWLVDLPGYGFARGPGAEREGWGPMIEGYLLGRASLKMVLVLIDAKLGPTKLDLGMLEWLQANRLPWRAVATKADQVKASRAAAQRRDAASALGLLPEALAWVSATEYAGVRELRSEVFSLLGP